MTSVLVVDDAPTDRELLGAILRRSGYRVLEAQNGERALALARAEQPDLIIADIFMPTMDGYELVRELRSDRSTEDIPVIFYTPTYVVEEVRRLAGALGVAQILVKPCEPETVLSVVEEALSFRPDQLEPLPSEECHRQHLRLLNAKLLEKVEELREAVILAGTLQRESDTAEGFPAWGGAHTGPDIESVLSPRELEVLRMIVQGYTNTEIATRLVIATSTAQSHVKRILHKLGVRNRTEAAVRYMRR